MNTSESTKKQEDTQKRKGSDQGTTAGNSSPTDSYRVIIQQQLKHLSDGVFLQRFDKILEKCSVLREYSQFIETVRKHGTEKEEMEAAVKECIDRGILSEYLSRRGSEVLNMLIAEYDYDTDIRVQREEAREEGVQEGRKAGILEGRKEGIQEGKVDMLLSLVRDGMISPSAAAIKIDMTEEKLKELLGETREIS